MKQPARPLYPRRMLKAAMFVCVACGGDHSYVWDDSKPVNEDFRRQLDRHARGGPCSHNRKRGKDVVKCGGSLREVQHPMMAPGDTWTNRQKELAEEHARNEAAIEQHAKAKLARDEAAKAEAEKTRGPRPAAPEAAGNPGVNAGITVTRGEGARPVAVETLTDGPRPAA